MLLLAGPSRLSSASHARLLRPPPTRSCFCDDGYLSTDCAVVANPFPSGAVAGALFGGLILTAGVMLGVAFYLARRSKATSSVDGFYGQVAA